MWVMVDVASESTFLVLALHDPVQYLGDVQFLVQIASEYVKRCQRPVDAVHADVLTDDKLERRRIESKLFDVINVLLPNKGGGVTDGVAPSRL